MSSSRYTQQRQTSLSSTSFNYEITKKSYIGKITLKDKRKSENSVAMQNNRRGEINKTYHSVKWLMANWQQHMQWLRQERFTEGFEQFVSSKMASGIVKYESHKN